MTPPPLDDAAMQRIFEELIVPTVFAPVPQVDKPLMALTVAQPGAGAGRAARPLAWSDLAFLSSRELRPFHPEYLRLSSSRSPEDAKILADSASVWMRSGLQHALSARRSVVLDGSFSSVDLAMTTVGVFAQSGFRSAVVVLAVPRAESLLASTSKYLLDDRADRAASLTTIAHHDAGLEYTRALVRMLEADPRVDRLAIVSRDGAVQFDRERGAGEGFAGASAVMARGQAARPTATAARRWLTELRAVTDYSLSQEHISRQLSEALMELHAIALEEVVPSITLPEDSLVRPLLERSLGEQLLAVRQNIQRDQRIEAPVGPVIAVPTPDIGISR